VNPNGVVGKRVQRIAATRTFARVAPKVVPPVDRTLHRLTRGRVLMSRAMVPTLVLTVTGAKSGAPRTVPLATLPERDGSFLVVGRNFAERTTRPGPTTCSPTPRRLSPSAGGSSPLRRGCSKATTGPRSGRSCSRCGRTTPPTPGAASEHCGSSGSPLGSSSEVRHQPARVIACQTLARAG